MCPAAKTITELLRDWQGGQKEALDQLMPMVYDRLRSLASRQLSAENPGHSLSATALVHEAYVKLVDTDLDFQDRAHFYALCARMIRRILIDHARANRRLKRGGDAIRLDLDEAVLLTDQTPDWLLALHAALESLAAFDSRKAEIVEMIFFGGMEQDSAAAVLKISPATLRRDLRLARAWLYSELRGELYS
ncbi:MAG: ECF-type sigma factor [Bryobacteraceae bacterium]